MITAHDLPWLLGVALPFGMAALASILMAIDGPPPKRPAMPTDGEDTS